MKAIELNVKSTDTEAVRQGLAVARSLVRARFLDAFDNGGTEVLSLLMTDIAEAMDDLDKENTTNVSFLTNYIKNTTNFMKSFNKLVCNPMM